MRKVILLFILIISVLGAWANGNVTFTASAPDVVVNGDQFRLTIRLTLIKSGIFVHLISRGSMS